MGMLPSGNSNPLSTYFRDRRRRAGSHTNEWELTMYRKIQKINNFCGGQHRKVGIVHKSIAPNVRKWTRYKIDRWPS
jgi:hypothetical protein